jgi:hypothetical protein
LWPSKKNTSKIDWLGDLALSCNPSYLGGQSSGMAWGGHTASGLRIDFEVRIKGFFNPKRPWSQYEEIQPGKHYLYGSPRWFKLETPPTQPDPALDRTVSNLSIKTKKIFLKKIDLQYIPFLRRFKNGIYFWCNHNKIKSSVTDQNIFTVSSSNYSYCTVGSWRKTL